MGIMDEKLFVKIINDFSGLSKANNFKGRVLFCNMGELFVHPAIALDRMRYVIASGLHFEIQTNAELLSPEIVDQLQKSGFNGPITVSFHGITPHVYKKVMGLNHERTLKNIDYLSQNYPKERIHIQSIPYHWPQGEARRIRKHFHRMGLSVRMPLPNNRAGLLPEIDVKRSKTLIACNANRVIGEMVICFNGNVLLCCNDMNQQEIVGNLYEKTIEEVWNGETMMHKINQIYCGEPSTDNFLCKQCEFGITSKSLLRRLIRNVKHETKKWVLTHLW
jgi:MoaA/NifB/PqqE/SkfB family radical SAM enzyme